MVYNLAQANIARMRGNVSDAVMQGLVLRIGEMNQLAEKSPGFVWRLPGSEATSKTLAVFKDYCVPFEPDRIFYNLSVWKSVEDLRHYTYKTVHSEMLRGQQNWLEPFDRAHLAMWWIPEGHKPTIAESAERLRRVSEIGESEMAFTFKRPFEKPKLA
jgi:hypothetical protein